MEVDGLPSEKCDFLASINSDDYGSLIADNVPIFAVPSQLRSNFYFSRLVLDDRFLFAEVVLMLGWKDHGQRRRRYPYVKRLRRNRLALLQEISRLLGQIADYSLVVIEG